MDLPYLLGWITRTAMRGRDKGGVPGQKREPSEDILGWRRHRVVFFFTQGGERPVHQIPRWAFRTRSAQPMIEMAIWSCLHYLHIRSSLYALFATDKTLLYRPPAWETNSSEKKTMVSFENAPVRDGRRPHELSSNKGSQGKFFFKNSQPTLRPTGAVN